jgi:pimeloyl-ACP methyl ester carboxylesterase
MVKESKMKSNKSFLKKAGRMVELGISVLVVCILILVGALLIMSPGNPAPILGADGKALAGSISEKTFITVNRVRQGMFIQGKDGTHPVLLILHGGMPEYFLTEKYPTGLEDTFTVVWWEQRGSGISYNANIPPETMTAEQMIADTIAVTNYLRSRFHQDKIYLMGHSGGSFIGIQAAARAPELYHAYIGQAQMANQLKSEKLAYEYMAQAFKENGNSQMLRQLEAAPVTLEGGTPAAYRAVRDQAMHSLGIGTFHTMNSVITGIFLPSWLSRAYTFAEKVNLWRGKAQAGISILWDTMITTDLSQQVTEFRIPVYFFSGIYDYTCNYSLVKDYFEKIKAPVKGFYTFDQSAHSPVFEEPQKVQQILHEDVLKGSNHLSDGN